MKNKLLLALIGLMLPLLAAAQDVSLSATNVAMRIGEYGRLTATVTPTTATVNWSSSDATVATVTNAGVIYAVGVGEATITASCGEVSAACSITVAPRDGDVNADGKHSVSDVTYTAGYIMETLAETNTFYKDAADIDKDGMVIVPDLTSIVDLVLDADNVPEAPHNVVAMGRINTVLVTWDAIAGADSYIVYRSADGADFEPIAFNVTEPSFVDEEPLDGTNYYKVGVVSGYAKSELSETVNAALVTEIPNNEIWYVTMNDEPIDIYDCTNTYGHQPFDKAIISHTYENGIGRIVCDGDIKRIYGQAIGYSAGIWITEIHFPNTIETLDINAISFLRNIRVLHIPDNLKFVGEAAFRSDSYSKLERFTGKNVSADGRCVIIDNVVYGFAPNGLIEYTIPSEAKALYWSAFAWCDEIKEFILPDGLDKIYGGCFSYCNKLEKITIPNSVEYIGFYAFKDSPNLEGFYGNSKFTTPDHKCLLTYIYDNDLPEWAGAWIDGVAGKGMTDYVIPEGVVGVQNYGFSNAKELRSITFPSSIVRVGNQSFYGCDKIESFHGKNTTSDSRGIIVDGELQCYAFGCKEKSYLIPMEVQSIGYACFSEQPYIEEIIVHDNVESIGGYAFSSCPSLKTLVLPARLKGFYGPGYNPFIHSDNLESIYFRSLLPPVYNDTQFYEMNPDLKIYVPEQTLPLYMNDPNWYDFHKYMVGYNYTDLPEDATPEGYYSTDYSKNGEVQKLQSATVGNGIDLVFMGDGFIDKDMDEGGKYEQVMNDAMEKFFSIEPYKTMRDRFNVYSVKVVSLNDQWDDNARHAIMENDNIAFKYASDIEGISQDHLYVNVIYNAPTDGSWYGRSYTTMYHNDGSYISYNMEGVNNVLIHEAAGHGFAKLADEYVEFDATFNDYYGLDQMHEMNWYQNVDYHNTPEDVYWNRFMADSRYDGQVGIYEGAFTYSNGVYRPTENSMMRYNDSPFNAPSREAIYKAIMRESEGDGWVYNYEDFVAYDEINRQAEANAPRRAPSRQEIEEYEKHHKAPVIVKGGWRDAAKKEETAAQATKRQMPMMASGHNPLHFDIPAITNEQSKTEKAPVRPKYSKVSTELSVFEMSEAQTADNVAAIDVSVKPGFIATQFDLLLPEGVNLSKVELSGKYTQTHKMTYRRLEDGRVRVVIYSMDNAEMEDNLVRLTLQGEGEVMLTNALVNEILPDGKIVEKAATSISAMVSGNATGISSAENSRQNVDGMYNLNGQKVNTDYKGIVIKKGNKVRNK